MPCAHHHHHHYVVTIIVVRIEVYDWDADGGHDFIGDCTTTLEELAQGEGFQIIQVHRIWDIVSVYIGHVL